jgi:hypothetical protein
MKKLTYILLVLIGVMIFQACDNTETYADQKKKERAAISKFISDSAINVISEATFFAQDSTTDVSKNQYVLFESNGVYMQIIRKGCGSKIKSGETASVLARFSEFNILGDSLQLTNNILYYSSVVDKMTVINSSGTFSGSFITTSSVMYSVYGSAAVPSGWLVPFTYINVGRPSSENDEIAEVKLIVPHSQGQTYASSGVYPCYYVITYERGR